ncbi:hypothetical protein Tco_1573272, partial [Tanacetum coccineum]
KRKLLGQGASLILQSKPSNHNNPSILHLEPLDPSTSHHLMISLRIANVARLYQTCQLNLLEGSVWVNGFYLVFNGGVKTGEDE